MLKWQYLVIFLMVGVFAFAKMTLSSDKQAPKLRPMAKSHQSLIAEPQVMPLDNLKYRLQTEVFLSGDSQNLKKLKYNWILPEGVEILEGTKSGYFSIRDNLLSLTVSTSDSNPKKAITLQIFGDKSGEKLGTAVSFNLSGAAADKEDLNSKSKSDKKVKLHL